jgi:hypothetical protein
MNHVTIPYPATLEVVSPPEYDRAQVLYRVALLVAIGILHRTVGSVFGVLYLFLPIFAAVSISRSGGFGLRRDDTRWFTAIIDWAVSFYAYFLFVTDRFPFGADARTARLAVQSSGLPRPAGALARLVTTLPHAIVLCVLGFAASLVATVIAISVLITGKCPDGLQTFQRDVVAWIGRVLAYHASLVDEYPPFSLAADRSTHVHS